MGAVQTRSLIASAGVHRVSGRTPVSRRAIDPGYSGPFEDGIV
jgi:hypothetical protein